MKFQNKINSISIVLPAFNEEEVIKEAVYNCYKACKNCFENFEIIVVDDGSTDNTRKICQELKKELSDNFLLICQGINVGYGAALRLGFSNASYDFVFFTDSDRQFDLSSIDSLTNLFNNFDIDIAIGYRESRQDKFFRKFISKIFNIIMKIIFKFNVKDIDCAFKLFKREVFEHIKIKSNYFMVNTEILAKAFHSGFKIKECPIKHFPRLGGHSTVRFFDIFKNIFELIRIYLDLNLSFKRKYPKNWWKK